MILFLYSIFGLEILSLRNAILISGCYCDPTHPEAKPKSSGRAETWQSPWYLLRIAARIGQARAAGPWSLAGEKRYNPQPFSSVSALKKLSCALFLAASQRKRYQPSSFGL